MFWVACVESRTDGKHYVLVGTVPGLLTDHIFVAKVGRAAPLSHAGFSYLPPPDKAAFGSGADEALPVIIESITVYPHALTGELPFVSLRFVEQVNGDAGEDSLAKASINFDGEEQSANTDAEKIVLLQVRSSPVSVSCEVHTNTASSSGGWCSAALRECGLLDVHESETAEERLERKARRRCEVPVVGGNQAQAPVSWAPSSGHCEPTAPGDDSLRHVPGG
eukprot:gnl/TRDRNA2_/TRDRNA2_165164_c1_seq6.p1 gnl/TRDRNA2_/TRDRNA2_165164_c1~~gnl/TRDRNA2_/TRDRNA2_165164_c1_seq6.p1  ORF type:complete len:222 (+),score=48.40 gnl/TRDRNA2_/TRDRNA2_165164_c1_seq6:277-942(+)